MGALESVCEPQRCCESRLCCAELEKSNGGAEEEEPPHASRHSAGTMIQESNRNRSGEPGTPRLDKTPRASQHEGRIRKLQETQRALNEQAVDDAVMAAAL